VKDWDAVVATGLSLPGVEPGTSYGKPAIKLRGKMLAATTAPTNDSFVLHVSIEEKEVLIETDPETFWETDHYSGWPAVLVRYGTPATDRISLVLSRAWWDRAPAALRKKYGERP